MISKNSEGPYQIVVLDRYGGKTFALGTYIFISFYQVQLNKLLVLFLSLLTTFLSW